MTLNRQVGRLAFPVTATGLASFHEVLPAQGVLLDIFKAAITSDLGAPWDSSALRTCLEGRQVVHHAARAQPTREYLETIKTDFPALFVYPLEESTSAAFTLSRDATTKRWGIEYVLGPLGPDELFRISGILEAIEALVQEVVRVGGHPAFALAPGGVQPQQVLYWDGSDVTIDDVTTEVPGCGFSSCKVIGSTRGAASFQEGGLVYHGVRVTLETTEVGGVANPTLGTAPHEGVDVAMTGDAAGTLEGFGDFQSNIPADP